MSVIRTFVAVAASDRVNNNVSRVISRLEATEAQYRWLEPENLHIPLNFVGDVKDIEVPEVCKMVKNALESFPRFEMSLQGVSAFPRPEQPRVLWMGVDEGRDALIDMYKALEDALYVWGVNKDRKEYVPHMTLGRIGRGGRWNDPMLDLMHRLRNHDGGFCTVTEAIIYSSFMDRSGPTYTPMSRVRLGG